LSRQLIQADKRRQELTGESLLQEIQDLIGRLKKLLKKAERSTEYASAISAAGQLGSTFEFLTKLGLYSEQNKTRQQQIREQADKLKTLSKKDLRELKRLYVKAGLMEDPYIEPAYKDDLAFDLEAEFTPIKRRRKIRKTGL
jgi:hypothetical protein